MTSAIPTLRHERALLREGATVVLGVDEVGRGAIAGPVAVGVAAVTLEHRTAPTGLRDSKLLPEPRREQLQPRVARWAPHSAVGLAEVEEVERIGIIAALGLAATRALAAVRALGLELDGAVVLLDGSHDWLSPVLRPAELGARPRVVTRVKADRTCAAVAAASVLAKVHRDRLMIAAHDGAPDYLWASNKGYASAEHYAAIDRLGPHALHRVSWLRTAVPLDGLEAV